MVIRVPHQPSHQMAPEMEEAWGLPAAPELATELAQASVPATAATLAAIAKGPPGGGGPGGSDGNNPDDPNRIIQPRRLPNVLE